MLKTKIGAIVVGLVCVLWWSSPPSTTTSPVVLKRITKLQHVEWHPVCRHNALFWTSMLGEKNEVRIMYGMLYDGALWGRHVQPQIKLNHTWYYFLIDKGKVILVKMPKNGWKPMYSMTFLQFAELHEKFMDMRSRK